MMSLALDETLAYTAQYGLTTADSLSLDDSHRLAGDPFLSGRRYIDPRRWSFENFRSCASG